MAEVRIGVSVDATGAVKSFKLISTGAKEAGKDASGLGKTIQQELNVKLQSVAGSAGPFGNILKSLGPAGLAAAAGIGAVAAAGAVAMRAIADLASEGERIANKSLITGWAAESVQALERLAKNSQVSSEAVFGGISKMQRAAVEGSKGFTTLGLGAAEFLRLAPEAQLQAVAEKIMALPTPAERAAAAMGLFGRSGAELLPILYQLAKGSGALIVALSEDQVAALTKLDVSLDNVSGAWSDLTNQLLATIATSPDAAQAVDDIATAISSLAAQIKESQAGLQLYVELLTRAAGLSGPNSPLGALRLVGLFTERGPKPKTPTGFGMEAPSSLPPLPSPAERFAEADRDRADKARLKALDERLELEKVINDAVDAGLEAMRKQTLEEAKLEQIAREHNKTLTKAEQLELAAVAAIEKGKALRGAVGLRDLDKMIDPNLGLWTRFGDVVDQEMQNIIDRQQEALDKEKRLADEAARWQGLLQGVALLAGAIGGKFGDVLQVVGNIGESFKGWEKMTPTQRFNTIASGVGQIGGLIGGKAGGALAGAAGGAMTGAAIGSMFGPLGTAIGGVIGGLVGGIAGWISAGKKAKEQMAEMKKTFIEAAGGMSALTTRAAAAGVSLDKLFAAKDTKALQAAMEEVQRTIDAFEAKMNGLRDARAAAEALMDRVAAGGISEKFGQAVGVMVQKVQDALLASGLGFMASGPLRQSEAFMGAQGAAGEVAQLLAGMRAGGFLDTGLLAAAGASAEELRAQAVAAAEAAGLAPAEATKAGFGAIAPLLREQLNASIASGTELDANTKALIEQAKANGISIIADPMVESVAVQKDMLRELKLLNGSGGGRADESFASGTFGLRRVERDMLAHVHAGEGLLVIPRAEMASTTFASFAGGTRADPRGPRDPRDRDRPGPGGGGGAAGGDSGGAGGGVAGKAEEILDEIRRRPAPVTQVFQPTFRLDPLQTKESREDLLVTLEREFVRMLRNNPTVQHAVKRAAGTG